MVFFALAVFTAYLMYTKVRFGWAPSISDTYYLLGKKGWIFQTTLLTICALMMAPLMELREGSFKLFEFLIVGGVAFVAVAPSFKLELEGTVHYVSAVVSGVSSIVVAIMCGLWFVPPIFLMVALGLIQKKGNPLLWIETALIYSIFAVVLLGK